MNRKILLIFFAFISVAGNISNGQAIRNGFENPPREFSVMPFWFWNDSLTSKDIIRQISDFEAHGVYGFVIHPRIGLPADIVWLSPAMIDLMRTAIEEASRRGMYIILYDEGMYPSGSSGGQVVARNPEHAAHGLAKIDLKQGETLQLPEGSKLITTITRPGGEKVAVIEKPSGGIIRGLHYLGSENERLREESPPAGDILNPEAVSSFIDLVYDKYAKEFGSYFGKTVIGIFTDEPSPLGRSSGRGIVPGNAALIPQINRITGYDITPYLSDLWYKDNPDSEKHRTDYNNAINRCLEENYYSRLSQWCSAHGISLMGHPAGSMDIGTERYFGVPGQDLVWRYVEPGAKALTGQHSTMAKCASSAMVHLGLRRNSNELYGAYGHNLTWDEMLWLANWCFVRGQNLLIPHAFYYSIRGPRFEERPPDVGPHAEWWSRYKPYADACRRLSWINTDSKQVCEVAVITDDIYLPDNAAKTLYQNQIDFNYLEYRHLSADCRISENGLEIAGMRYKAVIIDSLTIVPESVKPYLQKLADNGSLIISKNSSYSGKFKNAREVSDRAELLKILHSLISQDVVISPVSTSIRLRHVIKEGIHYYLLFNEENIQVDASVSVQARGKKMQWADQYSGKYNEAKQGGTVSFKPYEMKILLVSDLNLKQDIR
jgi:hypothetical protein